MVNRESVALLRMHIAIQNAAHQHNVWRERRRVEACGDDCRLHVREVLQREAGRVQLALLSAWPVLRLLAPFLSFCVQARAVLAGGQHCTALNLLVTPLYIAMNGFYLAKLWRQRGRRRAGGKRL